MALSFDGPHTLFAAAAVSTTVAIPRAGNYRWHQIGVVSVGGQWTAQVQWSPDDVTWYDVGALETFNGASETIEIEGVFPYLRLVATRTAGTCTAHAISSWATPEQ